jgi:hypothetical protein
MKIYVQVSAQDLLEAGAPLTAIRQSYRTYDKYEEKVVAHTPVTGVTDAKVIYESTGTSRENTHYFLPAKTAAGAEATAVTTLTGATVVWGGSIKDSYVKLAS